LNPQDDRLSGRNLWAYTLGSIGRDTASMLYTAYLLTFVIYTKSLTDAQFSVISMAMIAIMIFDGLNDPLMGNIIEVTRTKWGKFKPWTAAGMLGSALVYLISFTNGRAGWDYVILHIAMYFAYSIVFTMNDISYWGMLPSLASGKRDRDLLTSRTILFAGIGQGIAGIAVPTFTAGALTIGGSAVRAYAVIAVLFCAFFIAMQMITLLGVKEKPLPPRGSAAAIDRISLKTIWRTIRNNDQLLWCIAIYLAFTIGSNLITSVLGTNYIFFAFGYNGLLVTVFSALGAGAAALVMMFFTPIAKRFTRDQLMKLAVLCVAGGSAFMLLAGLLVPSSAGVLKFVLLMTGNLFAFAGQNVFYLVIMVCIANTIEYNEWRTGARAEGIIYSIRPLLTKIGHAVIQGAVLIIFLLIGVKDFTNQIADLETRASKGLIDGARKAAEIEAVLAGVPTGKSTALLACITVLPTLLALLSYYLYSKKFTITEERYEGILADLKERKNAGG